MTPHPYDWPHDGSRQYGKCAFFRPFRYDLIAAYVARNMARRAGELREYAPGYLVECDFALEYRIMEDEIHAHLYWTLWRGDTGETVRGPYTEAEVIDVLESLSLNTYVESTT